MHIDEKEVKTDREFGRWLKEQRQGARFTVIQAESITGIHRARIKQLESGTLIKGATRAECQALASLYRVSAEEAVSRAAGSSA